MRVGRSEVVEEAENRDMLPGEKSDDEWQLILLDLRRMSTSNIRAVKSRSSLVRGGSDTGRIRGGK